MYCSVCKQKQQFNKKGRDFELMKCNECSKPYCKECGTNNVCKTCIIEQSSNSEYIKSLGLETIT